MHSDDAMKREALAAFAMIGLIASGTPRSPEETASLAVQHADALILALDA